MRTLAVGHEFRDWLGSPGAVHGGLLDGAEAVDDILFRHLRSGNADLRLDTDLTWLPPRGGRRRAEARLHSNTGQPLRIGIQVCTPPKVTLYIRLVEHAWRLDVGGPEHRNRRTDHRHFARGESHVNVWRDGLGTGHAVPPWFPIRAGCPGSGIQAGDLETLFEDFCRGSGVHLGPNYRWSDPPDLPDTAEQEGDVP